MDPLEEIECFGSLLSDSIQTISGLYYFNNLLKEPLRHHLLTQIQICGWFQETNQVMHFGQLPHWLEPLLKAVDPYLPCWVSGRHPSFDQMIANYYKDGETLKAHIDLIDRFEDGILIASLQGFCEMEFSLEKTRKTMILSPGDVLILTREARWKWSHGIPNCWSEPLSKGRISITLRKLNGHSSTS